LITLLSDTAYPSFIGEVEASNTTTTRRLIPSACHQLPAIARASGASLTFAEYTSVGVSIAIPFGPLCPILENSSANYSFSLPESQLGGPWNDCCSGLEQAARRTPVPLRPLRIGTRGSPMALRQTALVADRLTAAHPDLAAIGAIEIVTIRT